MSTNAATRSRSRASGRRMSAARRRSVRRRRIVALLVVAGVAALAAITLLPNAEKAVQELALPLRHEDIIRQQSADKGLDPSLVAGIIYAESRFRDATSHAGARGLMQITPATADYIAQKSGGTKFEQGDLATPQINISYGAWYLRYLLDRYDGNEVLALCAYNGGEGNVDKWLQEAHVADTAFTLQRRALRRDARVRQAGARRPRRLPQAVSARARALASAGPASRDRVVSHLRDPHRAEARRTVGPRRHDRHDVRLEVHDERVVRAVGEEPDEHDLPVADGQRDVAGARRRLAHERPLERDGREGAVGVVVLLEGVAGVEAQRVARHDLVAGEIDLVDRGGEAGERDPPPAERPGASSRRSPRSPRPP